MKFTFVSTFPSLIKPYFMDSILHRACEQKLIEISFLNPRDFTQDHLRKTDDYMIGGGAGLLMKPLPIADAIKYLQNLNQDMHFIYLTPVGKKFNSTDAKRLAKHKNICFICGRYEGVDERIIEKYCNELFCIGDFVMTGGELGALCMCDAISRHVAGVLGNQESLEIESFENNILEAPSFTKPDIFEKIPAISDFLKGNHANIRFLKNQMAIAKTQFFRPDLYKNSPNKGKQ